METKQCIGNDVNGEGGKIIMIMIMMIIMIKMVMMKIMMKMMI